MITASHNPVQDNGFKFFKNNGTKLNESEELEIENMISYDKMVYSILSKEDRNN